MKKALKYMFIMVVALAMVACGGKNDEVPENISEDVIAIVNGSEVKIDKLEKTFTIIEKDYMEYWGEDIMAQEIDGKTVREIVRTEILNNLINDELIKQSMLEQGFEIDDVQVEEQFNLFAEEELGKKPEQQNFYTENGIGDDFIKESIKAQMYVQEYYRGLKEEVLLEEDDLEALYSTYVIQVNAKHILVEEEELANELIAKIEAGEDFAKLAEENSKDPGSAANGGDLGFFRRGQMVPEFNDMAFSLKPGEVSGLVKTDYGFHIIKVEATKTIDDMIAEGVEEAEVEEEKNMIVDGMLQEKASEVLSELITLAEIQKFEERVN